MATITVQPNQSMIDVIIQAMGTLEGGMCFCSLNGVAISDTPGVGMVYEIPDGTQTTLVGFNATVMANKAILKYLGDNEIVIGTLGGPRTQVFVTEDGESGFISEDGSENFVSEQ